MGSLSKFRASIVIAGVAAILLGAVGLTAWRLWDTRRLVIDDAFQVSDNLDAMLANEIRRDIETYALSLQAAVDGLKVPHLWKLSPQVRDAILFDNSSRAAQFGSILVIDAQGKVKIDSSGRLPPGTDRAQRRYFSAHRDQPGLGLLLTAPYRGSSPRQELLIQLSRRLEDAQGRFAGIVVGTVRIAYIEHLFAGIALGKGAAITLLDTDGTVVARTPFDAAEIGRRLDRAPVFKHFPAAPAGRFLDVGADGMPRLYVYRKLGKLPLLLTVATPEAGVLADWQRKAAIVSLLVACFFVVFGILAAILHHELRRRSAAERAARESERRYRLLADNASDMIVLARNGERLYVSPASRRLYGYEPDEMIGKTVDGIIHPDDLPAVTAAQQDMRAVGEARLTHRGIAKDGKIVWVEASWKRIVDPDSAAPEVVIVVRDVTQRVRNEEALRAAKEQADAANQTKSAFLAHMSHEIRTPMNGILGMNQLLLATPLDARQRQYAETIAESAAALLHVIDGILDQSKLEAGRVEIECVDFELAKTVDDVIAILRPRAAQKNVPLDAAIDPAAVGHFRGDPARLRQILLNIIGNAVKFTDRGRVALAVSLARAQDGGDAVLRFVVEDTGVGIAPEAQPRLFQRFAQADVSINRRFGGTGLGLAIAKQLVELMRGTIGFTSTPGAGSRFWFEIPLPRIAAPQPALVPVPAPSPQPADTAPHSSLDILIAEDNKINQQVAQLIVERGGHRVELVDDGGQAVEAARRKPYGAILMDLQMPELDGLEAARRIRQLPGTLGRVPIIALTSHATPGTLDEVLAAGMDDYVAKPFEAAVLLAKIAHLAAFGTGAERAPAPPAAPAGLPPATAPRFDAGKLDEIRAAISRSGFEALVAGLLQGLEERVARTVALVETGALGEADREAHDIVSVAGNVGGLRLSALARRLQLCCQAGDTAECRTAAAALRDEAAAVLPLMRDYRAAIAA